MIVLRDSSEGGKVLREGGKGERECFCIVIKHCNKMLYMNQGLACIVIKPKPFYYIIKAFVIKDLQAFLGYCNKSARN